MFENSPECPLTQLLDRKYGIHKECGDDQEPCGGPWHRNWEQEGEDDEKDECSYSADFAEEQSCKLATSSFEKEKQQDNHEEQAAPHEDTRKKYINQEDTKTNDTKLEDTNWKTPTRTVQETLQAMCALIAAKNYVELAS